jgi:hypothetical protein
LASKKILGDSHDPELMAGIPVPDFINWPQGVLIKTDQESDDLTLG